MEALWQFAAIKVYAIVAVALALQSIALAFGTAAVRTKRKQIVNPEDAAVVKGGKVEAVDHPDVQRVKRAHQNLLENIVPFYAVGLLYALTNPSALGAQAYCYTFLGTRLLHSVFYLWGRQPFRTLAFVVGVLALLGMCVHVLRFAVAL